MFTELLLVTLLTDSLAKKSQRPKIGITFGTYSFLLGFRCLLRKDFRKYTVIKFVIPTPKPRFL